MNRNNRFTVLALALALLLSASCAGHRGAQATYHDPNMDFGLIQSVAVLPFANLSPSSRAGETVREVFSTMLQASLAVYVHPPGEVHRALSRISPQNPTAPSPEEVVELARNIGADVVITGTVLEYGVARSGSASANVCSVSVKMLEGQTGRVIWSASATTGGVGATERLLGGGGQPMNIVVSQAVEDLLDRLFEGA
jgi:hypothetical protein